MEHPYGRCRLCGERIYAHVEGGYRCANCGTRYRPDSDEEDGDSTGEGTDGASGDDGEETRPSQAR